MMRLGVDVDELVRQPRHHFRARAVATQGPLAVFRIV
jgi:hypothetical protein